MRRAAKVDANQPDIVDALRAIGCTVQPLHAVGEGCPDILCGRSGLNFAMEIKDENQPPSKRKLTPDQQKWHGDWRGQVAVVKSPAEAIQLVCRAIQENKT